MTQPNGASNAFTRTDLVASLAAMCCVALLAPSLFGSGRSHGEAATCLENLRRLTRGWLVYASDHHGFLPPNPDDGSMIAGRAWVAGQAGRGGANEFDTGIITNPLQSLVYVYSGQDARLFRCPSDSRRGLYRPSGLPPVPDAPAARSFSANVAVGTNPNSPGCKTATDGAWLNNNHSHRANSPFRTYGKLDDIIAPSPAGLFLLIDEDEASLNDGLFAMGMLQAEWIDWPAARHDLAATVSFADGHAELHRWTDERTLVLNNLVSRRPVPNSEDWVWLQARTSASTQVQ